MGICRTGGFVHRLRNPKQTSEDHAYDRDQATYSRFAVRLVRVRPTSCTTSRFPKSRCSRSINIFRPALNRSSSSKDCRAVWCRHSAYPSSRGCPALWLDTSWRDTGSDHRRIALFSQVPCRSSPDTGAALGRFPDVAPPPMRAGSARWLRHNYMSSDGTIGGSKPGLPMLIAISPGAHTITPGICRGGEGCRPLATTPPMSCRSR